MEESPQAAGVKIQQTLEQTFITPRRPRFIPLLLAGRERVCWRSHVDTPPRGRLNRMSVVHVQPEAGSEARRHLWIMLQVLLNRVTVTKRGIETVSP